MINNHSVLSCQHVPRTARRRASRDGSVLMLMAILLPVLALLAAFCINAAHMQLTRTELVVATDAAARAGGRAFSEAQKVNAAKKAAVATAALNRVNGQPLRIRRGSGREEIEFGTISQPDGFGGRYEFTKVPTSAVSSGDLIADAIRVWGRRDADSLSGEVPLIMPGLLDLQSFAPIHHAVAMQVDRDISMILDRSGSMEQVEFDWPDGTSMDSRDFYRAAEDAGVLVRDRGNYNLAPGQTLYTAQAWAWEDYFKLGPAPPTPWMELVAAIDAFLNVLDGTNQKEHVSIASYSDAATLDTLLESDYSNVRATVGQLSTGGATAVGQGMEAGIQALLDSTARPFAAKTMVVMTDGNHNSGISPLTVAERFAAQYNLTIHTVTFGDGADQSLMQQVATAGGGQHYHAASGEELRSVFEEIANNLPTILTE